MIKKKAFKSKRKFKLSKVALRPKLIKKRRKEDYCLNCAAQYNKDNNYCPNCGQENNHNRASFGTLVVDFFHNYFSFDSKFSNSLLPFFFQPGYLTQKFIQGKRASFVNPVRLYLIISLLFFFVFSMVSKDLVQQSVSQVKESVEEIPDEQKKLLNNVLEGDFSQIEPDSLYTFDTVKKDSSDQNISYSVHSADSTNGFLTNENLAIYLAIREDYKYSVQEVMDTLDTSNLTDFEYSITQKLIRLERAEAQIIISQMLKNLPLMMMLLIPLFALVLKLFYIRRSQYYITHLIHALHLHSFAYIIYGMAFLMAMYWFPNAGFWIVLISVAVVTLHSYISFLKVYEQKKFKTFVKYNLIGFVYLILLFTALMVELFFSVITY